MKTIYRFEFPFDPAVSVSLSMTSGEIIGAVRTGSKVEMWAVQYPGAETRGRSFALMGTGWEMPDYIEPLVTFERDSTDCVWHLCEVIT